MSKAVVENKLAILIKDFYENLIYTINLRVQMKITMRKKRTYSLTLQLQVR